MLEQYYVISPTEETPQLKTQGYLQVCAIGNNVMAIAKEPCGEVYCEGSYEKCQKYYSDWFNQKSGR
jgi:hypothetical protein